MKCSTKTKRELAHIISVDRCCQIAELSAFYDFNGYLMGKGSYLDLNHSSPLVARKIFNLIKELFPKAPTKILTKPAQLRKNQVCTLRVLTGEHANLIYNILKDHSYSDCCRRSYIRGAFLSHGSVTTPAKAYHLEIFTDKLEIARKVHLTVSSLGLKPGMIVRNENIIVYLKGAEDIVTLLNLMGAHNALLEFESTRVIKDMRNQVNRLVNCETANVDKTIQAAIRQTETVKFIASRMSLSELPPNFMKLPGLD